MELTDPKFVYLVLDTGHATLGGIDPVKVLRDYYPRVASIHLKDAEAKYNTSNGWRGPAPSEDEHKRVNLYKRLGAGGVDFPRSSRSCGVADMTAGSRWTSTRRDPGRHRRQDMNSHKKYLTETLKGQLRT